MVGVDECRDCGQLARNRNNLLKVDAPLPRNKNQDC